MIRIQNGTINIESDATVGISVDDLKTNIQAVCAKRKIKCDRQLPCNNCIARGFSQCVYSKRLKPGPRSRTEDAVDRTEQRDEDTNKAVRIVRAPSMRVRFQPSIANGFYGQQENKFISGLFEGFTDVIPLVSEQIVRDAMLVLFRGFMSEAVAGDDVGSYPEGAPKSTIFP